MRLARPSTLWKFLTLEVHCKIDNVSTRLGRENLLVLSKLSEKAATRLRVYAVEIY